MISGYRELSQDEIDMMNKIKDWEVSVASLWQTVMQLPDVDGRWGSIARTHFQEGFTALVRSVARPEDPFKRSE